MRNSATLAVLLVTWLLATGSTGSNQATATYQLELAANRPPCEAESDPSVRCRGTKGERSTFTIRADGMLWFEQSEPAPVAFLFVGPLAVEPFAYPSPALGIGIQERADGLIVEAIYGLQRTTQSVELDRWVPVHLPPHASFWIRLGRDS